MLFTTDLSACVRTISKCRLALCTVLACSLALSIVACPAAPADETKVKTTELPGKTEPDANADTDESDYELMRLFVDTLDEVERNYVKPISRRELMEAAIDGVLAKLDSYSDYIKPGDLDRFRLEVENEFGGIGIRIRIGDEHGVLTVAATLKNTPADRAGLKSGDVIAEINGESTKGIGTENAVKLLRGRIGTEVTLTIQSGDSDERREVTLERDTIYLETVLGHSRKPDLQWDYMVDTDKRIGYIRISSFSRHTTGDLRQVLQQLTDAEMRGLVLDLRFNPGGLLEAAIDVCDLFVPKGRIVSTNGRNVKERTWEATNEGTFDGFPIVVLANHYSASASEIVSACLQDHDRAVVIGERTWGKGSVQRVIDLERGRSALKLTTASYLRPNGKNIHRFPGASEDDEWGVTPDEGMKLKLNRPEIAQLLDYQQRQSFPASISGPAKSGDEPVQEVYIDRQLAKAIEYLSNASEREKSAQEKSEASKD